MLKVFVSHSGEDGEISKKLSDLLFQDGGDVWIDYEKIRGGSQLAEKMGEGIVWCETFILLWSKAASKSPWVGEEWQCAWSLRIRIVPCLLDDTPLPAMLRSRSYVDLRNFGEGYKRLLGALGLESKAERVYIAESVRVKIEEPRNNELILGCYPPKGAAGLIVKAIISIKKNARKIAAFGLDVSSNPSILAFEGIEKGALTEDWAAVNGRELRPGEVRIGGFAGAGESIKEGSVGTIAAIKLRVACLGCKNEAKGRIGIFNLMDDIAGMNLSPSSVEFTYEKQET